MTNSLIVNPLAASTSKPNAGVRKNSNEPLRSQSRPRNQARENSIIASVPVLCCKSDTQRTLIQRRNHRRAPACHRRLASPPPFRLPWFPSVVFYLSVKSVKSVVNSILIAVFALSRLAAVAASANFPCYAHPTRHD
jgi:hypothetical protein